MYLNDGMPVFSPTDLCNFAESAFRSWMDRYELLHPGVVPKDPVSAEQSLLAAMGEGHEAKVLHELDDGSRVVTRISKSRATAPDETRRAMARGDHVIYQADLARDRFAGVADFLLRVPDERGRPRYEVADSKLARRVRPNFLLQLCAYADMLEAAQGWRPDRVWVIDGRRTWVPFRTDDFFFHYLALKAAFLRFHGRWSVGDRPLPEPGANHGPWQSFADSLLEQADHPCRIANVTRMQLRRLADAGYKTLRSVAEASNAKVPRIGDEVLARLSQQARLQMMSAGRAKPAFEILPHEAGRRTGLTLLPPPSPNDVFFDIEGDPLHRDGGLEYLFGASFREGVYRDWWAHDLRQERVAFQGFIDAVVERYRADPSMHVYHYGDYERAALRRLMGRHGTREDELDELLRSEVFVDLHQVVRQGVRVGTPSYSLKEVERLYRPCRAEDVKAATESMVEYARWLDAPDGEDWRTSKILCSIRDYNRADCESTAELAGWLWARQSDAGIEHVPERSPPSEEAAGARGSVPSKRAKARDASNRLAESLEASVPSDAEPSDPRRQVPTVLAHLLGFHRREAKPVWWWVFDRLTRTEAELYEDPDCLAGLVRTEREPIPLTRWSSGYEYRFDPDQDTQVSEGTRGCIWPHLDRRVTVHKMDAQAGIAVFKRQRSADGREPVPRRMTVIPIDMVRADAIEAALRRIAERYLSGAALPPALDDLLARRVPRLRGSVESLAAAEVEFGEEVSVDRACEIVQSLDGTTLAVQGPPGTGKTFLAARCAVRLLEEGKRVGVTSNSHAAIDQLMAEISKVADARGLSALRVGRVLPKGRTASVLEDRRVDRADEMGALCHRGSGAHQLVGGTAFAFADPAARGFDHLFVDEAGQVALANVVAMSEAATNLVLVGDPMQLPQPTRGTHPGESGLSALEYLLQGRATVSRDRGLFLNMTRRLHPAVCRFISETFYEGRLVHDPSTARRYIEHGPGSRLPPAGIVFEPVVHRGNGRSSDEEVARIRQLVRELSEAAVVSEADTSSAPPESDASIRRRAIDPARDVLVVAPYNAQVRRLQAALPGLRVGTVDRFQGQEAPVVIVSMCASDAESSPRGLEFLLDPNRSNVALSRARCLAIVVASPHLADCAASSLGQMKLLNLFHRLVAVGGTSEDGRNPPPAHPVGLAGPPAERVRCRDCHRSFDVEAEAEIGAAYMNPPYNYEEAHRHTCLACWLSIDRTSSTADMSGTSAHEESPQ